MPDSPSSLATKKFINNDCRISQIRAKSGNTGVHFDVKFEAAVKILAPNRKCIFKSPVRGCRGCIRLRYIDHHNFLHSGPLGTLSRQVFITLDVMQGDLTKQARRKRFHVCNKHYLVSESLQEKSLLSAATTKDVKLHTAWCMKSVVSLHCTLFFVHSLVYSVVSIFSMHLVVDGEMTSWVTYLFSSDQVNNTSGEVTMCLLFTRISHFHCDNSHRIRKCGFN